MSKTRNFSFSSFEKQRNINEGSRKTRPKQNWKESAFISFFRGCETIWEEGKERIKKMRLKQEENKFRASFFFAPITQKKQTKRREEKEKYNTKRERP
jgi:hypothetical protein